MATEEPRVLIGAPTAAPYAYCLAEWTARVKELSYKHKTAILVDNSESVPYHKTIEQHGIKAIRYPTFIKESRERLPASRNVLRQLVLDEGYDYFLSLEQDVIPPIQVIEQLLRHQKPVVSGVYYKYFDVAFKQGASVVRTIKKAVPLLAAHSPHPGKMRYLSAKEVEGDHFFPIRFCGLGCVLIHRAVLEKVSFRGDVTVPCHDDVWFCLDAFANSFPLFVDTSVKCKHLLSAKPGHLFADVRRDPPLRQQE